MRTLVFAVVVLVSVAIAPARAQFCPGAAPYVFTDVPANDAFCGSITWMAQTGVTDGCVFVNATTRLFCPDAFVTRKQMSAFMFRLSDALFPSTCAAGQVMKWNGLDWACSDDNIGGSGGGGTVTSVAASTGLTAAPNPIVGAGTISIVSSYRLPQGCGTNEIAKWNGSAWICALSAGGTLTSLSQGSGIVLTPNPIVATGTVAADTTYLQRRVSGTCAVGSSIRVINADGTVTCETDDSGGGAAAWALAGNAGTNPATQFLGTTDNVALVVRVNNLRALRIEPNPVSPNLIGGNPANGVTSGVRGATIGGGGVAPGDTDPDFTLEGPNVVTDAYGTVGGGYNNRAGNNAGTVVDAPFATVGGGGFNEASASYATVAGGGGNEAQRIYATVAGGEQNFVQGEHGSIGGGKQNLISNVPFATVAGGFSNWASGDHATIGGGENNTASGHHATIGGGEGNTASGLWASIDGGTSNLAGGLAASLGGGNLNNATGDGSAIGGGENNTASGVLSTIGGGSRNEGTGDHSSVAGGFSNTASGSTSAIGGGTNNTASALRSTVGGGTDNTASGDHSTIGGGLSNSAPGVRATVPGGAYNQANGNYSVAMGHYAVANGGGSFVFADGSDFTPVLSNTPNEFAVAATGGIALATTRTFSNVCRLAPGGGSWACTSDRNVKQDFAAVDVDAILNKVLSLPITTWRFKTQPETVRHLGPMSQDFRAAFALGTDDKTITQVDVNGVALAAIQGLNAKVETIVATKDAEIAALRRELAELRATRQSEVADLRRAIDVLMARTLAEGVVAAR